MSLDSSDNKKKGLALSGGGFRATLYALGALWRMNEDGLLTELDTITAVSGGAIASAFLMLKWHELKFIPIDKAKNRYRAENFEDVIVNPLLEFCKNTLTNKTQILLASINPFTTASISVRNKYDTLLFDHVKLCEIKEHTKVSTPEFVFYGTNYDTGVSVRISKNELSDYQIGTATNHGLTLAEAVTVSSGFPPFLSPIRLLGDKWLWTDSPYQTLHQCTVCKLRTRLDLCDGGLYDNMGIEMLWKQGSKKEYDVVFSCDAGAPFELPRIARGFWSKSWKNQFVRMSDIMINQQRALRKRVLIRNYIKNEYEGAYWSIEDEVAKYASVTPLLSGNQHCNYSYLKELETQLEPFQGDENKMLVNWGFCHADMNLRKWFDPSLCQPNLPFKL